MKKLIIYCLSGLLLLVVSCGETPTEDNAIDVNEKGITLINSGKYEEALQAFLKAVKNPALTKKSKGTIYRNIAITYNHLEKSDSAIHFSTLAAKCFKKNSYDYQVNMAGIDLHKGQTQKALTKLLKASAMNPEDLSVNNTLGLIYLGDYGDEFADPEKALPYNKKADAITSNRITEDILGRNYYDLENYETAEMYYEKIHTQYPEILSYTLSTGMIKYKLKKNEDAEILFKQVIAKDSSYRETIETFKENNR